MREGLNAGATVPPEVVNRLRVVVTEDPAEDVRQAASHVLRRCGREEIGYVPWQFNLPDPGFEAAWKFSTDPDYFFAEFGPAILIWLAILSLPVVAIWRRYRRLSAAV